MHPVDGADRRARSLAIAVGGAAGALVRWWVLRTWPAASGFDWAVLGCNVVGSALLGAALAQEWRHPAWRRFWHAGVAVGFCGGLTTMSTVALEVAELGRAGAGGTALAYTVASVATCLVAVVAGAAAAGARRAIDLPVEGGR